jgi:hypothetical protein
MTSCDLPRIRISDPGELIETVPYLLGFHPRQSLVLVGFADAGGFAGPQRIQVTVRLDLPDRLPGHLDVPALRPLGEVLRRAESGAMAAVLVTDSVPGDPRRSAELLACRDLLAVAMAEAGIEILDVLVATDRRWWSLCCEQPECCPSAGHERVLGCSPAAAQATFAGLVALPDRESLVASLAGQSIEQRSALLPALAEAQRRRASIPPDGVPRLRQADVAELLSDARLPGAQHPEGTGAQHPELTADDVVRYGVALTDRAVRDGVWLAIEDGSLPAAQLMAQLHTRLPPPYDAAPLFLFGWAQWRAGNSTLARMAAERALQSHPGYSAAVLLVSAAEEGIDPRSVPLLSQGRSEDGPWR